MKKLFHPLLIRAIRVIRGQKVSSGRWAAEWMNRGFRGLRGWGKVRGLHEDAGLWTKSYEADYQSALQPIANRRYRRSADWQSAVSPVGNRLADGRGNR